jgi:putative ABC transport system permease protein
LRATAPAALPRVGEIALHPAVLGFTALLSVVAGLLFGAIPVLKFASPRLSALKDGGRSASDGRDRHRTRSLLVVSEIALALVLLVASGLMIRSFLALRSVDPGFARGEQLLTFGLSLPRPPGSDAERLVRRQLEILTRLQQVPGVTSAALGSAVALDGRGMSNPLLIEEFPAEEHQAPLSRRMKWISPEYFGTMGTPLVAGRTFTWSEVFGYAPVVVVNERLARVYWKTAAEAVGKRVRESRASPWREIIGVVANARDDGLGQETPPMWYVPPVVKDFFGSGFATQPTMIAVVRSSRTGSPAFLKEVRQAVWSVDKSVPLANLATMEELAARSMAQTSFALVMLAMAAGVALLLGVVGIYAVIAYITAQRTREVGIRLALGAGPADVARLFLRHGAMLAAGGIAVGLLASAGVARVMTSLLFGVSATDPATYALVSIGLAAVALAACYFPSRRAARVPPVVALRSDG